MFTKSPDTLQVWQWSTTNWRLQKWLNNTLGNNTIECKKLATIVSGVPQCNSNVHCCYISALVLNCFCLNKDRATFFKIETYVASFLHSEVLLPKVLFNHFWKRQFVVLHCHIETWVYSEDLDEFYSYDAIIQKVIEACEKWPREKLFGKSHRNSFVETNLFCIFLRSVILT